MQARDLKKQMILDALAETMIELRGNNVQPRLSCNNGLSTAIINKCERGIKDPQLTTFFRLAEIYQISPDKFIAKILNKLPKDFSLTEQ